MSQNVCEHVHNSACKRKNISQTWFPEKFMAQQCGECAVFKKKKKKKKQLKKPAARLGFGGGLAEASEPMKQAEAGLANNSVPCSSFGGRSPPPLCKCLSPESLPPTPWIKAIAVSLPLFQL